MAITERQRLEIVRSMIMAETSCRESDLSDGLVHICEKDPAHAALSAHRRFPPPPGTMRAVTLGTGAVVAAEPEHLGWTLETYGCLDRDGVFDPMTMGEAARYWHGRGLKLYGPFPRFSASSDTVRAAAAPEGYTVRIVGPEIAARFDHSKWHNSLNPAREAVRPTMFAAAAFVSLPAGRQLDELQPVGVSAVAADSDYMWQIGIDVDEAHQGRGLATAIASLAARETLSHDRVPYWGATNSNIRSHRTALGAGLVLTYVEVLTRPLPAPG